MTAVFGSIGRTLTVTWDQPILNFSDASDIWIARFAGKEYFSVQSAVRVGTSQSRITFFNVFNATAAQTFDYNPPPDLIIADPTGTPAGAVDAFPIT